MYNINRLYIHVPFCQSKCDYCAFHSITSPSEAMISMYFKKLQQDFAYSSNLTVPLESIFIGGGTPSRLSNKNLIKLFDLIYSYFTINDSTEITIECNPESLTQEKIALLSRYVNRVSIGIQSFKNRFRTAIGRSGEITNINKIFNSLEKNNLPNISIDLIYGIPGQTLTDWEQELNQAIKLPIKHISAYSLTYEEGTTLIKNQNTITPDDYHKTHEEEINELHANMWELNSEILSTANIERYEISNYSLPGFECKHNLDTWYGGKYMGIGPTASSFGGASRWSQPKTNKWLDCNEIEIDILSPEERAKEIFLTGLRTKWGWSPFPVESVIKSSASDYFKTRCKNINWDNMIEGLQKINEAELLIFKLKETLISDIRSHSSDLFNFHIYPTEKGLLLWDEIALELL